MPLTKSTVDAYTGDLNVKSQKMTREETNRVLFYRDRFNNMARAREFQETVWERIRSLHDVFDDKVVTGHVFGERIRFPKLWAAVQRKKAEIVEFLPQVRFNSTFEDKKDSALAANSTIKHFENTSNARREEAEALRDAVLYGTGILFEGYSVVKQQVVPIKEGKLPKMLLQDGKKEEKMTYSGLDVRRIDPRDFYPDETAYRIFDETGQKGCRDVFMRKSYPYSSFVKQFGGEAFKNVDKVVPRGFQDSSFGDDKRTYKHERNDNKDLARMWVHVFEYYNVEEDIHAMIANGVEIYYGANPYKHKRLPFSVFYNYKKDDSFWGLSEAEIVAPFIYMDETIQNLMFDDTRLALQPAVAVDGELQVPKNGLQPGATLQWRGTAGGKLKDSVLPMRFGGIDQSGPLVREMLQDEMITTTGDDTRALHVNPNQLATQTLAKRESMLKRIRAMIYENTVDAKKDQALMRLSNIVQFGQAPVLTIKGNVRYRRIKIEGFDVHQQDPETEPKFIQRYGAEGHFFLNAKVLDQESYELEVIPQNQDELMKKDELQNLLTFASAYGNILQVAQGDPEQMKKISQEMDGVALLKQIARRFSEFDEDAVFPSSPEIEDGKDIIDREHEAILLGFNPPIKPNEDSRYHLERHLNFLEFVKGQVAKGVLKKKTLDVLNQHINATLESVKNQVIEKASGPRALPAGQPGQGRMDPGLQPTDQLPGQPPAPGVGGAAAPEAQSAVGPAAAQSRGGLARQGRDLRARVRG